MRPPLVFSSPFRLLREPRVTLSPSCSFASAVANAMADKKGKRAKTPALPAQTHPFNERGGRTPRLRNTRPIRTFQVYITRYESENTTEAKVQTWRRCVIIAERPFGTERKPPVRAPAEPANAGTRQQRIPRAVWQAQRPKPKPGPITKSGIPRQTVRRKGEPDAGSRTDTTLG